MRRNDLTGGMHRFRDTANPPAAYLTIYPPTKPLPSSVDSRINALPKSPKVVTSCFSTYLALEHVHNLLSTNPRKARWMNCRLVLSFRSQFFHNLRFFSSQAKLRSTTQRLGITANLCNSLRWAICTVTAWPSISCTPCAKGLPT